MSERVSIGSVEDRKLKRKIEEEPPALGKSTTMNESSSISMFAPSKSRRLSEDSRSSPKPIHPSNDEVQEENKLSCKFCNKKFRNAQGLGGHQNAHKKEQILLDMEKELKVNAVGIRPRNVHLYPYSLSSMSNLPLRRTPLRPNPMVHMPNIPCTLAPPGHGTNQRFSLAPHNYRMTSSWGGGATTSPWRLNPQTVGLWQQIPSLVESASKSPVVGSSPRVGAGFGGLTLQESPSVSTTDSPSADLDLSLKL